MKDSWRVVEMTPREVAPPMPYVLAQRTLELMRASYPERIFSLTHESLPISALVRLPSPDPDQGA